MYAYTFFYILMSGGEQKHYKMHLSSSFFFKYKKDLTKGNEKNHRYKSSFEEL